MNRQAAGQKVLRLVIGTAAILGALVLVYFSSSPTLTCSRQGTRVECVVNARMLYVIPVLEARAVGVRSAEMVGSATGRSTTPARLIFATDDGPVDLGYFSQRLAGSRQLLDAFTRERETAEVKVAEGVTMRSIAGHLAALVLLLLGGTVIVSAVRR